MGQYYKPVNLDKKQGLESWTYDTGAKLMEHSWLGNSFVNQVERLIAEDGDWYGNRIVWGGDYADPENPAAPEDEQYCLYDTIDDEKYHNELKLPHHKKAYRYLINLDTKQYVDYKKIPISDTWVHPDTGKKYHYRIHPLPLLTCEGNGRGGGDFHIHIPAEGEEPRNQGNTALIGTWARNRITVSTEKPSAEFTELKFDLVE